MARAIGATKPLAKDFTVRVLTGSDISACDTFVSRLAREDIRMRFGSPRCPVQYLLPAPRAASQDIAFAAVSAAGEILGIANLPRLTADAAELGLIVRSDYQRRGVGRSLIEHAAQWASGHDVSHIVGLILAENRPMLRLAHATGFRASPRVLPWVEVCLEIRAQC